MGVQNKGKGIQMISIFQLVEQAYSEKGNLSSPNGSQAYMYDHPITRLGVCILYHWVTGRRLVGARFQYHCTMVSVNNEHKLPFVKDTVSDKYSLSKTHRCYVWIR